MAIKFESKEWFVFVLSILFITGIAILLDIPFIRQIFGFIFLTFLPGVLILQILKLNKLNTTETVLYSVGLSLAFVMFTGFSMNMIYPTLGFSKPLSTLPLIITISVILLLLSVMGYLRNKDFSISTTVNIKELFSPSVLFLVLLPIMSILGMCMYNFYGNNLVLLISIILISTVVVLATFEIIPAKHYSLATFAIALALVFYGSLITFYIVGAARDMAIEFYYYDLVMLNSYWDSTLPANVNAMLSITVLPVIFSKLLNIAGEWVFRIIYPLIFAFVPLTLYQVYQKQTDTKIAFLSTFFFMALPTFFFMIPILARMTIAALFFALLILLMIEQKIARWKRTLLTIIFALSLAVSHYGTSYFYMFYLLAFCFISFVAGREFISNFWMNSRKTIKKYGITVSEQIKSMEADSRTITKTFVLIYLTFALSWYMYLTSSSALFSIVRISDHVYNAMLTDLLNPGAREALTLTAVGMGPEVTSLWHLFSRCIWYITELFIIVGFLSIIINHGKLKFKYEYVILSFISSILLAMCIGLPFFSVKFSVMRIYHISLFFLAPFCIIGGQNIFKWILRLWNRLSNQIRSEKNSRSLSTCFLLIILIPYFLFTSGVIFTFTDDPPAFCPLSAEKYKTSNDIDLKATYLYYCIPKEDFISAKWLSVHKKDKSVIYTGYTSRRYLLKPYPLPPTECIRILDRPYLFSWDNVPGNDSRKLLRYLKDDLDIGWTESAEIQKSNDGKTIRIFEDENSTEMIIDEKEEKVTLKISDGRTRNLKVKIVEGKLNILDRPPRDIESDAFVYLRYFNIEDNKIIISRTVSKLKYIYTYYNTTDFLKIFKRIKYIQMELRFIVDFLILTNNF